MRLVISWVWIEESDIDPLIPDPLGNTKKGKHSLNSFNTRDDYCTILNYNLKGKKKKN